MLRHYVDANRDNWDELLPYIQFALNTAVASHGYTPFYLNTGRIVISPFSRELGVTDEKMLMKDTKQQKQF